jgi:hypothetical protein
MIKINNAACAKKEVASVTAISRTPQHHQAFQILAFWKANRHRVVGRALQALADEAVHTRIQAGRGHNFVKQICADTA